jgi:hypothetical protein
MHIVWSLVILGIVLLILWSIKIIHIDSLDDATKDELKQREKIKDTLYGGNKIKTNKIST